MSVDVYKLAENSKHIRLSQVEIKYTLMDVKLIIFLKNLPATTSNII